MVKAPVYTADGEKKGDRDLPESLFDGVVHEASMWLAVKAYLANQRQANAATKTRAMVSGGGKKPWRQKGTGRARQGSIRSPQWRGGGVVFGPRVGRNYSQAVPRKVRWLARRSAYNARALDQGVMLIDNLAFDAPKTRRLAQLITATGVTGNVLFLTDTHSPALYLSGRNLEGVEVRRFGEESVYDLLWSDVVIIEASALERAAEVAHA
ncbi:MAG: 50S ribosomal protein L4 [Gemmatimonadetes bacterium]|nr:50S ribosomal protein L4 [Gemmatimonadota bacterium]